MCRPTLSVAVIVGAASFLMTAPSFGRTPVENPDQDTPAGVYPMPVLVSVAPL